MKELAEQEGVSMNQFITLAVSEKMSALLTVDYPKARSEELWGQRHLYGELCKKGSDSK